MLRISYSDLIGYSEGFSADGGRRLIESYPQLLRGIISDNLTKKQKCYIILYYKDGLTVAEIAERFGVNKSTVSRTINRGRARLANSIKCELVRRSIERGAGKPDTEDDNEQNADS